MSAVPRAVATAPACSARTIPLHSACPAFEPSAVDRPLGAIERHGDRPVGQPELLGEPVLQDGRLALEPVRQRRVAATPGEAGDPLLGVEHVALDLGQGDRRLGHRSVAASGSSRTSPSSPGCGGRCPPVARIRRTRRRRGRPTCRSSRGPPGHSARAGRPARRRRSSRASRRAGSATAASRRSSRSTARRAARRSGSSRRSAARGGSCRARRRATRPPPSPGAWPGCRGSATASRGANAIAWSDVISASRPNRVVNHGTPAAMNRSPAGSVDSRRHRSSSERWTTWLISSWSVSMVAFRLSHASWARAGSSASGSRACTRLGRLARGVDRPGDQAPLAGAELAAPAGQRPSRSGRRAPAG